uniref:Uncharacterized protein LOC110223364 n=1 Tax=Phascolarctos cinereus TaxID=38626 RepID=A0A6P5M7N9_PHACI|nr:uncharacterized protein LOC110223364 [Phascolarctos cinereus]
MDRRGSLRFSLSLALRNPFQRELPSLSLLLGWRKTWPSLPWEREAPGRCKACRGSPRIGQGGPSSVQSWSLPDLFFKAGPRRQRGSAARHVRRCRPLISRRKLLTPDTEGDALGQRPPKVPPAGGKERSWGKGKGLAPGGSPGVLPPPPAQLPPFISPRPVPRWLNQPRLCRAQLECNLQARTSGFGLLSRPKAAGSGSQELHGHRPPQGSRPPLSLLNISSGTVEQLRRLSSKHSLPIPVIGVKRLEKALKKRSLVSCLSFPVSRIGLM